MAGQTDVNLSDIQAFRNQFNLTANPPQLVLYGPDPGTIAGDAEEADLDLEWTGALARKATIIYAYSRNVITSVQYAINQNLAPVISLSYGGCEPQNSPGLRSLAQQANAQGITWISASGDSGAAACDGGTEKSAKQGLAVSFPASIPEVTAVGGSEFNEGSGNFWNTANGANGGSALSYIPEVAWNDSASRGELAASGGGASIFYLKPAWQTGLGVPSDNARDLPDVSLSASPDHDGYLFYTGGNLGVVGGTSVSTPAFAAIVSLLNQYLVSKGAQSKPGMGNINPTLYHLAGGSTSPFHDITVGNNIVPCVIGSPNCTTGSLGYSAGNGYDLVTGLGSVDANKLITQWTTLPASISTTLTLIATPSSIANTASAALSATIKPATGTTAPTGSVTFVRGNTTLAVVAVASSGSNAVATLNLSGSALAFGNNTITATYGGSASFTGSVAPAVGTVTNPSAPTSTTTTVSANPASITTAGSTVLTAIVTPGAGTAAPAGSVTFSLGNTTLGSAVLTVSGANASATLALSGSKLAAGNNTITVSDTGGAGFTGSAATVIVNVTTPQATLSTTTTVAANPASINSTASTVLTATVKPVSGTAAPTGTVIFTLGSATLGTVTLTANGASAIAALTVHGSQLVGGANTIKATYGGSTTFSGSNGSAGITVVGSSPNSNVVPTITPNPVTKQRGAWYFAIQLVENGGGATTLTNFTVNGTSYASMIPAFFGTASIPAHGTLVSNVVMNNVPVPTSIVFGFSGTDANGRQWTQTVTVPFD